MEYLEIFKANQPKDAADFFRKKLIFTLGPMDIDLARKKNQMTNFVLIDVRAAEDYNKEHIPGAVSLPEDLWPTLKGLSKEKLNVLYCYAQTCHLAARAALYFAEKGFPVSEMEGGFKDYKEHDLEVETGERKVA